jgi:aspartate ammonia-lyase
MAITRTERDALGAVDLPADALHGIHTHRARANFSLAGRPVHRALVHAYGAVKMAACRTNHEIGSIAEDIAGAIEAACDEMMAGSLDHAVLVDALQGGAGTSTNMNINEVLANRALQLLGRRPGDHATIDPIGTVNLHQSTNDTYPTALRIAAIRGLRSLERDVVTLLESCQRQEKSLADVVKIGRTQLQDAVPTTIGRTFGAFAEALARDRWRAFKAEERLRVVNLGGTAIGTGLGAPRDYIFRVVDHLRAITGLGLARAENLVEATQNLDPFVEASGMVRALASNLIKISNDLRLLSSGPDAGLGEIRLPALQPGSSIMPGKINPVAPEAVIQAALVASSCDQTLFTACSLGNLELNHLMPLVADSLLTALDLLGNACRLLATRCVDGIAPDRDRCKSHVHGSVATATSLVDHIGYHAAEEAARVARESSLPIRDVIINRGLLTPESFDAALAPEAVTRLGSITRDDASTRENPPT